MSLTTRFGLNYVPSKRWWYSWVDWDGVAILEDLQAIASLGFDHIRIHCLWPLFQPNAAYVSAAMLDRLGSLLDIAGSVGLDVEIAVLDGWLSGFAFSPAWQGQRNMFTDASMVEAEMLLFRAIASKVAWHPSFLGFDLGNELGCMNHFGNPMSVYEGDAWNSQMMELCQELAPGKLNVNGVDHQPWFCDRSFSRQALSNTGTATSLHAWIEFTGASSLYPHDGAGCLHLAEYCIELAKAYSLDVSRPLWLQEFGASSEWMPEAAIPDFAEGTIRNALTCRGLWGVTWWCSHDIDTKLAGFSPLEYDLGVLDIRNRVKPVGERIAGLIAEHRANPTRELVRNSALVLPDRLFGLSEADGLPSPGWRLGMPYMDLVAHGVRPSIVLESRSGDPEYLKARGIEELLNIPT